MREGKTQIGKWKTQPRGALNQCLSKQAVSVSLSAAIFLSLLDITSASPSRLALADPHSFIYQFSVFTISHALCQLIKLPFLLQNVPNIL